MTKDIKERIEELRAEIKRHNELYYIGGAPEISDSAYDALVRDLRSLETQYPEYDSTDSPTHTVGSPVPDKFSKVEHIVPMLSLESVHDEAGAVKFDDTCKKNADSPVDYLCEPKLDGLSVELVYTDGKFLRAATRGDGYTGEEVTRNIATIANVPRKLKGVHPPGLLAVRGEVMMHISDFQELNRCRISSGDEPYANPRNVAAGSIRQLDHRVTADRRLHVYCYRILSIEGAEPDTQKTAMDMLRGWGFTVSPGMRACPGISEAIAYHHELEAEREALDYEIDGVVIKVNDMATRSRLGMRTNNPRWAVAYKFSPRKEVTRVEDILVQVGRTGVLTPLALLQPVEVGGVTVSRATLHNMDQVERLGIMVGDHVKVERAGDVIPYISEVLKDERDGNEKPFRMPDKCPSCGAEVEKEDVFYRCPAGLSCPAQVTEKITHYVSKGAVDIDGLSEKTVGMLYEKGIIKRVSDIYGLKREQLLGLEGFKEKKTENILEAIEKARSIELDSFIFGLGIRNVGKHLARVIALRFGTLEDVMKADESELTGVNEIGREIARSIVDFFSEPSNIAEIEKMKELGVVIKEKTAPEGKRLSGKRIVFTGSLKKMTRSEASRAAEEQGAVISSGISHGVDLVVAGEKAGSKLKKAREKGIKVISEEDFLGILSG